MWINYASRIVATNVCNNVVHVSSFSPRKSEVVCIWLKCLVNNDYILFGSSFLGKSSGTSTVFSISWSATGMKRVLERKLPKLFQMLPCGLSYCPNSSLNCIYPEALLIYSVAVCSAQDVVVTLEINFSGVPISFGGKSIKTAKFRVVGNCQTRLKSCDMWFFAHISLRVGSLLKASPGAYPFLFQNCRSYIWRICRVRFGVQGADRGFHFCLTRSLHLPRNVGSE